MPSHYRARVNTIEALENIQYMELLTDKDNIQFDLKPFTLPSESAGRRGMLILEAPIIEIFKEC